MNITKRKLQLATAHAKLATLNSGLRIGYAKVTPSSVKISNPYSDQLRATAKNCSGVSRMVGVDYINRINELNIERKSGVSYERRAELLLEIRELNEKLVAVGTKVYVPSKLKSDEKVKGDYWKSAPQVKDNEFGEGLRNGDKIIPINTLITQIMKRMAHCSKGMRVSPENVKSIRTFATQARELCREHGRTDLIESITKFQKELLK
jgi:hypothetical protein